MATSKTHLHTRIESGRPILIAEMTPPSGTDPTPVRTAARQLAGKIHALGVSDNREKVCMSALAAAALVAGEGVEAILHITTRDRNRIALTSDALGAQAMGVRNLLCTSGTHQTLGHCRSAKNVFDLDPIQLVALYNGLEQNASAVGEERLDGPGPYCLGTTASPYADPVEMQVMHLAKAAAAGAKFAVTQPVFDIERFESWWREVTRRGLHEKVAVLAGIRPLASAEATKQYAAKRPRPMIPDAVIKRMTTPSDASGQRAAGIEIALETVRRLSAMKGLRGFEFRGDGDLAMAAEVLDKAGLGVD